jgi:hypothetical protein
MSSQIVVLKMMNSRIREYLLIDDDTFTPILNTCSQLRTRAFQSVSL